MRAPNMSGTLIKADGTPLVSSVVFQGIVPQGTLTVSGQVQTVNSNSSGYLELYLAPGKYEMTIVNSGDRLRLSVPDTASNSITDLID